MAINFSEMGFVKLRKTIDTGDKDFPIEIYNPTKEQRLKLLDIIKGSIEMNKDGSGMRAVVTDNDIIYKVLGELTNIYLDLEDKETINNILENPSDLLIKVKRELVSILDDVFLAYYEELKSIGKLPDEIQDELLKITKEINIDEEKLAKEKEKEELRKRLAELENEQE